MNSSLLLVVAALAVRVGALAPAAATGADQSPAAALHEQADTGDPSGLGKRHPRWRPTKAAHRSSDRASSDLAGRASYLVRLAHPRPAFRRVAPPPRRPLEVLPQRASATRGLSGLSPTCVGAWKRGTACGVLETGGVAAMRYEGSRPGSASRTPSLGRLCATECRK